ncbi:MAG: transporter [bacterium]
MTVIRQLAIGLLIGLVALPQARAQDNYEIQVYGAETMPMGTTMFELHSNYATSGRRFLSAGVLPTNHALHETLEITHGFTPWFEVGTYLFMSGATGQGFNVVGSHLRPRVAVPESWNAPVGLSLSMEVGYQKREFSEDTWSMELRPIIDKQLGGWYASFNPTLERSLRGDNAGVGFEFAPNAVVNRDITSLVNVGVEYYGGLGPIKALDPRGEQSHQLFGVVNLNFADDWEFNTGVGFGLTDASERRMVKLILGRRVGRAPEKAKP